MKNPLTPDQQKTLRETGLLADSGDRWDHPSGAFHLTPLPTVFEAKRRNRSDRMGKAEIERRGLSKTGKAEKPASKRGRSKR